MTPVAHLRTRDDSYLDALVEGHDGLNEADRAIVEQLRASIPTCLLRRRHEANCRALLAQLNRCNDSAAALRAVGDDEPGLEIRSAHGGPVGPAPQPASQGDEGRA